MCKIEVEPGPCGFTTQITATLLDDGTVALEFESDCELVQQFAEQHPIVDPLKALSNGDAFADCRVCHRTCLVPLATLKIVEATAGLALPRDAVIRFIER